MKNILAFALAAAMLVACGQSNSSNPTAGATTTGNTPAPVASRGKQLFMNNCAQCHGLKQDKLAPMLDGVFTRWNNDSVKVAEFVKNSQQVIQGGQNAYATALYHKWSDGMMPSFGNLKDDEIQAILTYIHTGVE